MRTFRALTVLALSLAFCPGRPCQGSDITINRLFTDHMVLQRDSSVAVWGTAEPGSELVLTFNGQELVCTAGADGNWQVTIDTPTGGGPYDMKVRLKGREARIELSDILVGEVWLCSGQSNMEWPVSSAGFAERETALAARFPSVRLFKVERNASIQPLADIERATGWEICSPQAVAGFSAVAWAFARHYHEATGIPVGMIQAAWGGTVAETWMEFSAIEQNPALAPLAEHWNQIDPAADPRRPGTLFNGMIAPLSRFRFAGVLWYQGEANVGRGAQYRTLFPALIANWRERLAGGAELPFYFVQLAPFRYGNRPVEALAELQEAQLLTMQSVPGTGMVVTMDIGNVEDIHPPNKTEVGRRLAFWAMERSDAVRQEVVAKRNGRHPSVNGEPDAAGTETAALAAAVCGPLLRGFRVEGSQIILEFDHASGALRSAGDEPLREFQICGPDGQFHPARAEISGTAVIVSSPEVPEPRHVRYGWRDSATASLFNAAGFPASPFRTDSFPLLSENASF